MRVVYGINPVIEALRAGKTRPSKVLLLATRRDAKTDEIARLAKETGAVVTRVPADELERSSGTEKHQGAVAVFAEQFKYVDVEDIISACKASGSPALVLVLDGVQDPQNLGSLLRAADCAGAHGVVIPKDRACEVTPAVEKASAGAASRVPVAREVNITAAINKLKGSGVWVGAIESDAKESIYAADLSGDTALVIGSEGKGIRRLVRENCDFAVSIPMAGAVGSLNAAQAGVVALFEAARQRTSGKRSVGE